MPVTKRPAVICDIEEIDPDTAKQWLGVNHKNRGLQIPTVDRLKGIIARGEWMEDSTDGIGLDVDGGVVNGQHRLTAIAEGDYPVRALVVRNVRPEVIRVIDQGIPRNLRDILAMTGRYVRCGELASSIATLWNIMHDLEKTVPTALKPTVPQLLEFFEQHPHLTDSVEAAAITNLGLNGLPRKAAAYHYLMATIDPDATDDFFSKLETGLEVEAGEPVGALREKILANMAATKPESAPTILAWLVKAWEATRAGEELTKRNLKWNPRGARAEDYPKVSGVGFDTDGSVVLIATVTEDDEEA